MSTRPTFKEYLVEYDRYFNSFSEVINKEDDKKTKKKAGASDGKTDKQKQPDCDEIEKGDGKEGLDPCKFRQWMEISIAGD